MNWLYWGVINVTVVFIKSNRFILFSVYLSSLDLKYTDLASVD